MLTLCVCDSKTHQTHTFSCFYVEIQFEHLLGVDQKICEFLLKGGTPYCWQIGRWYFQALPKYEISDWMICMYKWLGVKYLQRLLVLHRKNCVLSLGSRHSVEPRNLSHQTREKVCVWCVFESHTHSVNVQKLSHWYCFVKWCPGAESNHRHEDFQYRWQ